MASGTFGTNNNMTSNTALNRSADYAVDQLGFTATRPLSLSAWEAIGHDLASFLSGPQWAIGDWLNYGEDVFGETKHTKTEFDEVTRKVYRAQGVSRWDKPADITGLSAGMLMEYARIARAYPREERVPTLAWGRHRDAALIVANKRRAFLQRAVAEHWDSNQWEVELIHAPREPRSAIMSARRRRGKNKPGGSIECPHCHQPIAKSFVRKLLSQK